MFRRCRYVLCIVPFRTPPFIFSLSKMSVFSLSKRSFAITNASLIFHIVKFVFVASFLVYSNCIVCPVKCVVPSSCHTPSEHEDSVLHTTKEPTQLFQGSPFTIHKINRIFDTSVNICTTCTCNKAEFLVPYGMPFTGSHTTYQILKRNYLWRSQCIADQHKQNIIDPGSAIRNIENIKVLFY